MSATSIGQSFSVTTHSPEETLALGEQFAARLKGGDVVALEGELGTGKTHFVKGVCRGLGFRGVVSSPTFALIQEYATTPPVFHVDLYRVERASQLEALGLEEVMMPTAIVFIEWPAIARSILPSGAWRVECRHDVAENDRSFLITRNE